MKTMISLYSGGGGIDRGAHQAGAKTILAIDHEEAECETIKENFPDAEVICGKVGDYLASLPKADIVAGGPPCPEFSRANLGRSFDMCEVNNFWEAVDIVKPEYYLMENVQDVNKKLIKHNFKVCCADYGAPTDRTRRIYTNIPLPAATHAEKPQDTLFGTKLKPWVTIEDAIGFKGWFEDRKSTFGEKYGKDDGKFRRWSTDRPVNTLLADNRLWLIEDLKAKNPTIFEKHKPNHIKKPMGTILAKNRGVQPDEMITDGEYARKATLEELAILQGFPKEHKFVGNLGEIRRMIGNAVPPPVIKAFLTQVV